MPIITNGGLVCYFRVIGPPSAHLPGSAVFLRKLPMQLCAYPVTTLVKVVAFEVQV